jgi:hypothetical protein
MTNSAITVKTVPQKFGSCLLRLQECELLLKSLVVHTGVTAPPEHLQDALRAKASSVQRQTMGQVVGMLTESTLVQTGAISIPSTSPDDSRALVQLKYQIELPSEQYDALQSTLKELIDLRNELVHHFLQRFSLRSVEGRTAASTYLDECSQIIDAHRSTLIGFTKAMELLRAQLASFIGSQEFEDAILQGGLPD